MQACEIEKAKPGSLFVINGELWMRMSDNVALHIEGNVINMKTGKWCHWQRLVDWDKEIA